MADIYFMPGPLEFIIIFLILVMLGGGLLAVLLLARSQANAGGRRQACEDCNALLPEGAKHCPDCGVPVGEE